MPFSEALFTSEEVVVPVDVHGAAVFPTTGLVSAVLTGGWFVVIRFLPVVSMEKGFEAVPQHC